MSGDGIKFEAFGAGGPAQAVEPASPNKTLRDEFAMAALSGILSSKDMVIAIREVARPMGRGPVESVAGVAYEYADAMLKARLGDA